MAANVASAIHVYVSNWDVATQDWVAGKQSLLEAGSVTIGSVTANAGTNLNTSLLATQATLASLLTELQAKADLGETQPVSLATAPALVAGSATIGAVNQTTGQGKTLLFAAITQSVAGTTQLVAADSTKKIKVVSYVFTLSLAGTVKFTGTADLTAAMTFAANGGASAIGAPSAHIMETAVNNALSIVSTVGAANGHISYFLEA